MFYDFDDYQEFLMKNKCEYLVENDLGLAILNPEPLNKLKLNKTKMKEVWGWWYDLLKFYTLENQQYKALLTDEYLGHNWQFLQLHHALITKGDIRGIKDERRNLIHSSYNVIMTSAKEHLGGQDKANDRVFCAGKLSSLYGQEPIEEWYTSFPMKSQLPNIF